MITIHDILFYAWPNRGWTVYGNQITAGDGGPVPTMEEIEAQRSFVESIISAKIADREARELGRTTLRASWDSLPAYIRGPFREKFEVANKLLDEGDDEAAIAMIEYTEAPTSFTTEQLSVFNSTKTNMKLGIENLPTLQ
jgi:hypothetical protein